MSARKLTVMECDDPDCNVQRVVNPGDTPPLGYYLDKGHHHYGGGGGPIPKTYACCIEHLAAAVEARIAEEW